MNVDAVCRAIRAFESYVQDVEENFLHPREQLFLGLPKEQQDFLRPIHDYKRQSCRRAFALNGELAEAIADHSRELFFHSELRDYVRHQLQNQATRPKNEDRAIVRAAIRQIWRDWSSAAHEEREACYSPVIAEIERRFANVEKRDVTVLIPGCGLGRLAYEIAGLGYAVEANDVSYVTLLANVFVISRDPTAMQAKFLLCPWATHFSNHEHINRQFAEYEVTTAKSSHGTRLTNPPRLQSTRSMTFAASFLGPGGSLTLNDKDFTKDMSGAEYTAAYDVVATCFFVDTAKNLLEYVSCIKHILKPGGVWINVGPLLWNCYENGPGGRREGDVDVDEDQRARQSPLDRHIGAEWDGKLEFSLEEVLIVIEGMDMVIEKHRFVQTAGYVMDVESMLQAKYRLAFWVARKPTMHQVVLTSESR